MKTEIAYYNMKCYFLFKGTTAVLLLWFNMEYRTQNTKMQYLLKCCIMAMRRTHPKYHAGPESLELRRAPKATCTTSSNTSVQAAAKVGPALEDNEKLNSQHWSKCNMR